MVSAPVPARYGEKAAAALEPDLEKRANAGVYDTLQATWNAGAQVSALRPEYLPGSDEPGESHNHGHRGRQGGPLPDQAPGPRTPVGAAVTQTGPGDRQALPARQPSPGTPRPWL